MIKIAIDRIIRDPTAEEQAEMDAQIVKDNQERKDNYLTKIKKNEIRKIKRN